MTDQTLLEQLASERERRAAEWDGLTPTERRYRILGKLDLTGWFLAAEIAASLGIPGARRLGRGAVAGSWTGYMSPALRICPSLRSSAKLGLVRMRIQPDERTRFLYQLTPSGLAWLEAHE